MLSALLGLLIYLLAALDSPFRGELVLDPKRSKLCIPDGWWAGNDLEALFANIHFELSAGFHNPQSSSAREDQS